MHRLVLLALSSLLAACSTVPDRATRLQTAQALATDAHWQAQPLKTSTFDLQAWVPSATPRGDTLTVYIEGDGLAWLDSSSPSSDPTPVHPLVLQLALAQPRGDSAYLARPCQYTHDSHCNPGYWTGKRFSAEVVAAMDQGLDALKRQRGASRLVLVGYSGGAAITALLAERRHDISAWVTVAGNIDVQAWTRYHRISPLTGSLDPMAQPESLRGLPQWHFVGGADPIVPPALVQNFAHDMPTARVIERQGYDHQCCWAKDWAQVYPL